jgi:hypothetical protein
MITTLILPKLHVRRKEIKEVEINFSFVFLQAALKMAYMFTDTLLSSA